MMDFEIDVLVAEALTVPKTAVSGIQTAVRTTLAHEQVTQAALTVYLTSDDEVQAMNRDYRGEDRPTDVLSFPAGAEMAPAEMADYLGDIAISVETAVFQAEKSGHTLQDELQLLAVHGTLHLLGYDHLEAAEKEAMWAVQTAVLARLNLSHVTPTEDPHD